MPKRARSFWSPLATPTPRVTALSGAVVSGFAPPPSCAFAGAKTAAAASRKNVRGSPVSGIGVFMSARPLFFSAKHELRRRDGERRIVAAVDLRVAVQATPALRQEHASLARDGPRRHARLAPQRRNHRAVRRVALVAQKRR